MSFFSTGNKKNRITPITLSLSFSNHHFCVFISCLSSPLNWAWNWVWEWSLPDSTCWYSLALLYNHYPSDALFHPLSLSHRNKLNIWKQSTVWGQTWDIVHAGQQIIFVSTRVETNPKEGCYNPNNPYAFGHSGSDRKWVFSIQNHFSQHLSADRSINCHSQNKDFWLKTSQSTMNFNWLNVDFTL